MARWPVYRSHQSARYRIAIGETAEDHSSSGLIVASGTGATGWARSVAEATHLDLALGREERAVGYWVREPFPSIATVRRCAPASSPIGPSPSPRG